MSAASALHLRKQFLEDELANREEVVQSALNHAKKQHDKLLAGQFVPTLNETLHLLALAREVTRLQAELKQFQSIPLGVLAPLLTASALRNYNTTQTQTHEAQH